ncbi:MAG: SDR family NAD(P)-dependent oxidoreductase [Polyangiaceae bacterium]|jgi:uncharacterized oxidoreductase
MKLDGNTILITGGTSGIGLESAKEFLKRSNTVIITGRDKKRLERVKSELPQLNTIQSDVSRIEDINALFARVSKEFPALNVVMNNAGVMRTINLHDEGQSLEELTREIDINFKGPVWMVKRFLPHLKKMPTAAIINVSSGLAFVPLPSSPVYCATKAAMNSFSRSLRVQLKNTKVKVFELAPPATETALFDAKSPDLEGVTLMKVDDLVRRFLKGLERDQLEIRPGQANSLKFMNRMAPEFILGQLSKPMDRMLEKSSS